MIDLTLFAKSFLHIVNNPYAVFAFLVFMFIFSKKEHCYFDLICVLILTMMYNFILKNVFKFPLPETCPGTGYGFPSGHMNFQTAFYVWLITANKNTAVRLALCLLLITIGTCIVLAGYHYARDVILTPLFSCSFIAVYKYARAKLENDAMVSITLILSTVFSATIYAMKDAAFFKLCCSLYIVLLSFCTFSTWRPSFGFLKNFGFFKNFEFLKDAERPRPYAKLIMAAGFLLFNFFIAARITPITLFQEALTVLVIGCVCYIRTPLKNLAARFFVG
ncbi:MAG: hypothetical protein LBM19_01215 [Holosporales bacterium]|jgi:membrane-associated phospholipid phosphatase|nr:hypothetical protein [Holosporales bacterium]